MESKSIWKNQTLEKANSFRKQTHLKNHLEKSNSFEKIGKLWCRVAYDRVAYDIMKECFPNTNELTIIYEPLKE